MVFEWFVQKDGQVHGPYTGAQLQQFVGDGRVHPNTPVRQGNTGQWVHASQVRGLFAPAPAAPPPPHVAPPVINVPPVRPAPPPVPAHYPPPPQPAAADPNDFFAQLGGGGSPAPTAGGYGAASATASTQASSYSRPQKNSQTKTYSIAGGVLAIVAAVLSLAARGGLFTNHQRDFEAAIKTQNTKLPMQVDENVRLDRFEAGPKLTCTIVYTMNVDTLPADAKLEIQNRITRNVRQDPNMKPLIKLGCTFRIRFLNPAGKNILEFGT